MLACRLPRALPIHLEVETNTIPAAWPHPFTSMDTRSFDTMASESANAMASEPTDTVANEPVEAATPATPSLPEWTRQLAAGDDAAWDWFHARYYLQLLRYAASRTGNPSAAGDVVQLAYLRIARHVRPFDDEAGFWGWLCCLVRCAAADHGRHITRRALLLEKFAHWRAAQSPEADAPHPSSLDVPALAEEALARLEDDDAALLRRKYYDGCSTAELAAALGATPKAIENRLARLRERLREIILRIR